MTRTTHIASFSVCIDCAIVRRHLHDVCLYHICICIYICTYATYVYAPMRTAYIYIRLIESRHLNQSVQHHQPVTNLFE